MASFFGEIIEPSTRAIYDESSDEEETVPDPELQLSWSAGKTRPEVLEVLFVFHGKLSVAFAETYLLEENLCPAAEIRILENSFSSEGNENKVKSLPCRIYINSNIAICLVSPTISSDFGYHFTETLSPLLKISKKVIVFTNDSIYNFKCQSINEFPPAFSRELKTTFNTSENAAAKLETPNFIIGIPAGVLSWCQIFKKDASAFVCYSDQEKLDSITATPYLSVLKKLQYEVVKNQNPDFSRRSFYGKPEIIGGSSNMYM